MLLIVTLFSHSRGLIVTMNPNTLPFTCIYPNPLSGNLSKVMLPTMMSDNSAANSQKLDISISHGSRIWVILRIDPKADAHAKVAPLWTLSSE